MIDINYKEQYLSFMPNTLVIKLFIYQNTRNIITIMTLICTKLLKHSL